MCYSTITHRYLRILKKLLQPATYLQFRSLTPLRTERRNAIIIQRGRKRIAHALRFII